MNPIPVIDLFSGPGGLAEGFAQSRTLNGRNRFRIELSVEMEASAHRTLRLRSFLRKFPSFPKEYYDFLNGVVESEPDWAALYPKEWKESGADTQQLELGKKDAEVLLDQRIRSIRNEHGDRTVLLGGPPCQAYSIAGRARNAGNSLYNIDEDNRLLLYKEYARILGRLKPLVAILENVRGVLSARYQGKSVFADIMEALQNAGDENQYRLYSLAPATGERFWDHGLDPEDFLIRAEDFGVPQRRHRVFVICIRSDIAANLRVEKLPKLIPGSEQVTLHDVIGKMPYLRSRLSRGDDGKIWQCAVADAYKLVEKYFPRMSPCNERKFRSALKLGLESAQGEPLPFRDFTEASSTGVSDSCPENLREWLCDENLKRLPNNETRGHIREDIARYLFATAYGQVFAKSPRSQDFPTQLAPAHANWKSGKFSDRFRVQLRDQPSTTITSHISKDGHYFIHPDPRQCRSLTVREAARLQTFPDNYFFQGGRTQQYVQVGNAVPPFLAHQIAKQVFEVVLPKEYVSHKRLVQDEYVTNGIGIQNR